MEKLPLIETIRTQDSDVFMRVELTATAEDTYAVEIFIVTEYGSNVRKIRDDYFGTLLFAERWYNEKISQLRSVLEG